uniref:Uncharacterized protein n=1 Tax=Tanacetum cinerariifolium TaxID=118510 RepID=A0A6L2KNI5_TANCI|nr:hypothetical protein [Tanacetum cinerariifolium]
MKTTPPTSSLTWKPTGRIFTQVSLTWIPIRKPVETRYSMNDSASPLGKKTHNPKTIIYANSSSLSAVTMEILPEPSLNKLCGRKSYKKEMVLSKSQQIQIDKSEFCLIKLLKRFWQERERERERKARTTLLMAIPEDHLAKFHKMTDAKEMWEAIKSRFGVSTEDANQKFLRSLPSFWSQVSLIMMTKPGVDTLIFDDLYNNLRVFESNVKVFLLLLAITHKRKALHHILMISCTPSLLINPVVAMISTRLKKFYKKIGRKLHFDAKEPVGFDKSKFECLNCYNTGQFARECISKGNQDKHKAMVTINREGIDWTGHAEDKTEDYALMDFNSSNSGSDTEMSAKDKCGLGYGSQIHDGVLSYENEVFASVFDSRYSDVEDSPVNDRFAKVKGMHAVLPPMTGNYMPPKSDFGIDESNFTYGPKQSATSESDAKTSDLDFFDSTSSEETLKNDNPYQTLKRKGIVDSGCSRHMIWNNAYLVDYQDFNGGPVAFGGSKGQITGKDTECLVFSPDFKLPDENQVLLRVHKQHNMYSFNLENIVPSGGLACLIAKATVDESTKWYKRMTIPVLLVTKESNTRPPVRPKSSKAKNKDEKLNEDTGLKTNEELVYQEDQAFLEELERLKRQETEANDAAKTLRKTFAKINDASTPLNTASTLTNQDDYQIPSLEDIYEVSKDRIFTSASYDDEGAVADFTNLETTMNFSPIPTSRIHSIYPTTQILGDPTSAVQTRSKVNKNFKAHAFMDMKSAFLYGKIDEEVYVSQPSGFIDPKFLNKKSWCDEFEALMKNKFQISSIEILKKFDFLSVKIASTPIETKKPLVMDKEAADVDVHLYKFMIGSLMYLTASRPDIMYLKGQPKLGLWYPRGLSFDLEAYSDSDFAGANLDRKSTTGDCQFFGKRLISWQCKKQTIVATLTTEAEHHFIRDAYEKKLIQVLKIHTDDNVKTVNDEVRIQALVDGKRVNIKESSIRRTLRLDDAEVLKPHHGMSSAVLWHMPSFVYLQIRNSISQGDMAHHKDIFDTPSLTKKVFANIKRVCTRFSGEVTLLFDNMLVQAPKEVVEQTLPSPSNDPLPSGEDSLKLKELIDLIEKLEGRVARLEEENKVLKELKSAHFTDDDDEPVMEKEKSSKQGRKIADIDADSKTNLEKAQAEAYNLYLDHQEKVLSMMDVNEKEPANVKEVLEVVKATKLMTKVVTTAGATKHYNYNQTFLDEVNKGVKVSETEVRQEKDAEVEISKRKGGSLEQEIAKKQKIKEETEELKKHLQIVTDDDDVYTDATLLVSKIHIINYKIHTERNKPYFKTIRADGNHMLFISLSTMLKNFYREDLESLWIIVRDRFKKTKPKKYSDD